MGKKEGKKRAPAFLRRLRETLRQNRFLTVGLVTLLLVASMVGLYYLNRGQIRREEEGANLTVAVTALPGTLDPAENTANQPETVMQHLFENLLRQQEVDGEVQLTPGQAESYDVEKRYDGTVLYTFHLRKNAKWSDGEPVKAQDFVYAWRRLADPANQNSSAAFYLDMIAGYSEVQSSGDTEKLQVSAVDESTFQVLLSSQCTYFLTDTCTSGATMPLRSDMQAGWDSDAEKFINNGAYVLTEWKSGQSMRLEKNEAYYGVSLLRPNSILFHSYADADAAYADYTDKKVDFVLELPDSVVKDFSLTQFSREIIESETGDDWDVSAYLSSYAVLFNQQTEAFNDLRVRQAFSKSIDRAALVKALGGVKIAATGVVPYGVADDTQGSDFRTVGGNFYGTDAESYKQQKEEAVKLLEDAGYPGGEGFPSVEYWYINTTENAAVARQLQTMWKNVLGVTVKLRGVPEENWEEQLQTDAFSLIGYEMTSPYNDAQYFLSQWTTECAANWMHYSSHVYDLLINASNNFTVEGTHSAYLHEAESLLMEDYAMAPLYYNTSAYAVREGLTGLYNDTEGHYFFYYVTERAA